MLPRISHCTPRFYSQAVAVLTKFHTPTQHHTVSKRPQQQSQKCIREQLRELLRETAQPVAVVTAFMPPSSASSQQTTNRSSLSVKALHHGATLSSFTSIAMDPYPLVTFALRIPSRMATTLNLAASLPQNKTPAQMVINILSSTQSKHALAFSRPDLYPTPFTDPDIVYTLSQEGIPVLEGSLGAISCRLVGRSMPLHDLEFLTSAEEEGRRRAALKKGAVASELFIAQVTRVEALASTPMLPLLYHRKKFTSCIPCPPDPLS
ncbi:hypothetical protein AN958_09707 [Leucoagaricus sp. SymC.cos]|nr:hypothetical protein AN958_09707 [Leucoagaricus sp. SymC.cos]